MEKLRQLGEGICHLLQQAFHFPFLPSVSTLSGLTLLSSLLWRVFRGPLVLQSAALWLPHQFTDCGQDHRIKSSTRTTIFLETASTSSCIQTFSQQTKSSHKKMTHYFHLLVSLLNCTQTSSPETFNGLNFVCQDAEQLHTCIWNIFFLHHVMFLDLKK